MTDEVTHHAERHRYELHADGGVAVMEYEERGEAIAITHTLVPDRLAGRGLGTSLVKAGLADLRQRGIKVIPECPFVARYIERHPEEQDLLA